MFVNHIPKCAGTSLYHILEKYFASRDIFDSEISERIFDQDLPLLGYLSPNFLSKFELICGHFGNTIKTLWLENHYSVGLTRNPKDRFISSMLHGIREKRHQDLPLFDFVFQDIEQDIRSIYNQMIKTSELYYYAKNSTLIDRELNISEPESEDLLSILRKSLQFGGAHYDIIIDAGDMDNFLTSAFPASAVHRRRNVTPSSDIDNFKITKKFEKLEKLFPSFFELERALHRKLCAISNGLVFKPILIENFQHKERAIIVDMSGIVDLEGFSKREANNLPGWNGENIRIIEDRASIIKINVSTIMGKMSRLTLCFWRSSVEVDIDVCLNSAEVSDVDWFFPHYPDEHLIYYSSEIRTAEEELICQITWNGEGRVDLLGGAVTPIKTPARAAGLVA